MMHTFYSKLSNLLIFHLSFQNIYSFINLSSKFILENWLWSEKRRSEMTVLKFWSSIKSMKFKKIRNELIYYIINISFVENKKGLVPSPHRIFQKASELKPAFWDPPAFWGPVTCITIWYSTLKICTSSYQLLLTGQVMTPYSIPKSSLQNNP